LGYAVRLCLRNKKYKWPNKYAKKCPISLAMREMKIKTTLRFSLPPNKRHQKRHQKSNKSWEGCGGKGTLQYVVRM
jgi:hypothetical protein